MRTRKWIWLVISLTVAVLLPQNVMTVRAAQTEEIAGSEEETPVPVDAVLEKVLQQFEFTELEELLRKIFPEQQMTFRQLLGTILEGDLTQAGNCSEFGSRTDCFMKSAQEEIRSNNFCCWRFWQQS